MKPFLKLNPEYEKALEIVQIPERIIQFRVVWEDDKGKPQVNRGYRVQVRLSSELHGVADAHKVRSNRSITLRSGRTRAACVCTRP